MSQLARQLSATPLEIVEMLGGPTPVALPSGVKAGPFELIGLVDFDAAADTVIVDFKDVASYRDDFKKGLPTSGDKLPIILAIWGLTHRWIDQAVLDHADPEDVYRVWEDTYLEVVQGDVTKKFYINDANCVAAQPVGLIDSDQAVETRAYRYKTNGLWVPPTKTMLFNLGTIDSLRLMCGPSGSASLLGANADTRLRVDGAAWRSDDPGWLGTDQDHLKCECTHEQSRTLMADNEKKAGLFQTLRRIGDYRF